MKGLIWSGNPKRGKVRDIYDLGDKLLIVVTDRISAFDVILPNGIPNKGMVLNQISKFWFDQTRDLIPNHFLSSDVNDYNRSSKRYQRSVRELCRIV